MQCDILSLSLVLLLQGGRLLVAMEVAVGGGAELCTPRDTNTGSEGPQCPSRLLQPRLWGALSPYPWDSQPRGG